MVPRSRMRRPISRKVVIAGVVAAIAAVGGLFFWATRERLPEFIHEQASQLPAWERQAQAQGWLKTTETIQTRGPNAAPLYRQWMKDWNRISISDRQELWRACERFAASENPNPRSLLAALRKVPDPMLSLREALDSPTCDFQYQLGGREIVLTPELLMLQRLATLEWARSKIALSEGRWNSALEHLSNAQQLLLHGGQSPFFFSALRVRQFEFKVWSLAVDLIRARQNDPSARAAVRQIIERWEARLRPRDAFLWEARRQFQEASQISLVIPSLSSGNRKIKERALLAAIVRRWNQAMKIVEDPQISSFQAPPKLAAVDKEFRERTLSLVVDRSLLGPNLTNAYIRIRSMDAYIQMLLAALDVMDERDRSGQYPPQFRTGRPDALGRGEIQYRRTELGFKVYSVGLDGVDEGGRPVYGDDIGLGDIALQDSPEPDDREPAGFRRVLGKPLGVGLRR